MQFKALAPTEISLQPGARGHCNGQPDCARLLTCADYALQRELWLHEPDKWREAMRGPQMSVAAQARLSPAAFS